MIVLNPFDDANGNPNGGIAVDPAPNKGSQRPMFWNRIPKPKTTAFILLSEKEAAEAFVEDVENALRHQKAAVVISHFTETHKRVQTQLESRGITTKTLTAVSELNSGAFESMARMGSVALAPFPLLQLAAPFQKHAGPSLGKADLFVPELHPTRRRDALVESFARSIPFATQLKLYEAMDSPLLSSFMDPDKMRGFLQQFGIKLDERVESDFVTNALFKAQKRIEKKVPNEQEAASQQHWFELNLR